MRYGTVTALDGVSFNAERGELVALLGPNGAGKTTTVETLEGYRVASSGRASVLGLDPRDAGLEYLEIVGHWLKALGARWSDAAREEALQWSLQRGSRSGRVAYQFARDWAGWHPKK